MIRTLFGLIIILTFGAVAISVIPDLQMHNELQQTGEYYVANGTDDTGATNLVTAVIVAYRGLDTLGEVVVLFCAATAVVLILTLFPMGMKPSEPSRIVALIAKVFPAPILLFAVYLITHSQVSPGGGFPGGAVIASAFLLVMLGCNSVPSGSKKLHAVESLAGLTFGLLGFWGTLSVSQFLNSAFLGVGTPGNLISAGLIPIVSIVIGAKVASEFSGVFRAFRNTGEEI